MPGVQLTQSLARWCCGTVRYAVTEEMLLLSEIVRRFLGNLTLGWEELSVKPGWHMINQNMDLLKICLLVNAFCLKYKSSLIDQCAHLPGSFPVMSTESSKSQTFPWLWGSSSNVTAEKTAERHRKGQNSHMNINDVSAFYFSFDKCNICVIFQSKRWQLYMGMWLVQM